MAVPIPPYGWQARLRRVGAPTAWALGTYWGTTVLGIATATFSLAALLPVASLFKLTPSITPRLHPWTLGAPAFGPGWDVNAQTPAILQQLAIDVVSHLLVATTIAVVAIAGLTILTLFGARASHRAPEIAVRRAVGAARRWVMASSLLEAALIVVAALALGGALGAVGIRISEHTWPGSLDDARLTASGLAVLAVGSITLVGVSLPPALVLTRRVVEQPARPVPLFLPAMQLGMSLLVLAVGAHLTRYATSLTSSQTQAAHGGEVFAITAPTTNPGDRSAIYAGLLNRLSRRPEFDSVSLTSPGALVGLGTVAVVTTVCTNCVEGGIRAPWQYESATHEFVSADSFRAMGVQVLAGRGITAADQWSSARVAVISRGLAVRHFARGKALGGMIKLGDDPIHWHTVVGIVADPPHIGLGAPLEPPFTVYSSILQHPGRSVELLVRPRPGADRPATTVGRALIESLGPSAASVQTITESGLLEAQFAPWRWFGYWFGVEGWTMLAIAAAGTFTLMRLWVRSLLAELGLRRAVGARRSEVLALVLRRAAGVGVAGTAIGLWFAPGVWGAVQSVVAGLPPWDAGIVAPLATLLVGIALAGALLPALRATRTPPATLLG